MRILCLLRQCWVFKSEIRNPQSTYREHKVRIAEVYNPAWDSARSELPGRVYEDADLFLASNFECGNGFRFARLDNSRYSLEIEPEPGTHRFSGNGCYFCFVALNKHESPQEVTIEVTAPDEAWDRSMKEEELAEWTRIHPGEFPPRSYAASSRFVIVKRADAWSHLSKEQLLRPGNRHQIAFSSLLPAASEPDPALFFSNYHWYPYSEMSLYLRHLQEKYEQLTVRSLGRSVQGRDMWVAEIGNEREEAPKIVCAATPQPNEMGAWVCRGLLDFLLGEDPKAGEILRRHRVCLVPHPNPDGTVLGYMASDAMGKFVYFMGKQTIQGDADAPSEQVALWNYLKLQMPWLFIEWHSNHWDWREGHSLLRYDPELVTDPTVRRIWDAWDRWLDAMPNICVPKHPRSNRTNGYTDSLGIGAATELGAIPAMLKVHDKYPLEEILEWAISAFCGAVDAYAECMEERKT